MNANEIIEEAKKEFLLERKRELIELEKEKMQAKVEARKSFFARLFPWRIVRIDDHVIKVLRRDGWRVQDGSVVGNYYQYSITKYRGFRYDRCK